MRDGGIVHVPSLTVMEGNNSSGVSCIEILVGHFLKGETNAF